MISSLLINLDMVSSVMRAVSFSESCMRESADDGPSVARYLNSVSGFQVSEYFGLGGRFRNIAFIIRCTFLVSPTVSPFHLCAFY